MKALILLLLLTACAAPSPVEVFEVVQTVEVPIIVYEEIEIQTFQDETGFLPLVIVNDQPCRDIENVVYLRYIYEEREEGPFIVLDCVQLSDNFPVEISRDEMVYVAGTNLLHWGIAQEGDPIVGTDLQVLVWQGRRSPYVVNLIRPTPEVTP